ncbi:unnamed protein product [Pylaiella littoralis]
MSDAKPAPAPEPPSARVAPPPQTQGVAPLLAPAPAPQPPPPRSPPIASGDPPSPRKVSPERRQAPATAPATVTVTGTAPATAPSTAPAPTTALTPAPAPVPAASDGVMAGGGRGEASLTRTATNPVQGQAQGQTATATRPSPDIRRSRADLPSGLARSPPSNSPPHRPSSVPYGGLIPAAVPSGAVAGVAGPGGGALSGVYLGALGYGGWGAGSGGSGGAQQQQQQQQQPLYPLSLPPVSPASATSSGRYVVGVSPASASSSHQKGMFSMASSATSGSELMYSPSPSNMGREVQEAQRQRRMRVGAREVLAPSVGSAGSTKGFTRHTAGRNNGSGRHRHGGGSGPVDTGAGRGIDRTREANEGGEVGTEVEENSDHSGEGVEDDGVSTVSRSSLLVGEPRPDVTKHRSPATIFPTGGGSGGGGGGGGGSTSEGLEDYKLGEGKDNLSDDSRHMGSDDGDADGLVGSTFLGNFGDQGAVATAAGVRVGAVGGGADGWARVRGLRSHPLSYRYHHPKIRPTHASPKVAPTEACHKTHADDHGLGGMEFVCSPGGTGVLNAFCSPLSEATAAAAGSEMTQAAKLATSVRFGGVSDIQANLDRAEKSHLIGRDGEGASLLMHAAQRGETEVFRVVLDFLGDKLTHQEVLAEFCAQDEDGQTPLLFAARSGSGAVFRQALEALLARATPEKVLQELTAKEEGDWTPLMAAAESGSVDCFHEVLHAIQERGSEDSVMSELMTKDNGGWSPLMFASCSGNRFVFIAAMEAFIGRGEEGSRVLKEQLLMGSQDRDKGCILEAVALAGWLSSPQLQPAVLDVLDAAWDELEYERIMVSADQQAFQHAVRQRDLLGLSCILSHGFGLSPALIEGLVESCGPRCVQDCFMEAVASARNPLVPSLGLLSSLSTAKEEAACPLHASWFLFMQRMLEKLVLQVLNNLPVSARAFNKRGIGGWSSNVSRMNSFARMNNGASTGAAFIVGGGGGGAAGVGSNRHRRLRGGSFNSGNNLAAGVLGGGGGVNGNGTMGPNNGSIAVGSGHEGGSGKATDSGGSHAVVYNARAKESLLVAKWVFEPEAEAVGMRGAAFEGPLAVALRIGWEQFVCSPIVLDLLRAKLTAGVELGMFSSAAKPAQWYAKQAGPAASGSCVTAAAMVAAPVHSTTAAATAAVAAATATGRAEGGDARRSSPGCLEKVAAGDWDITVAPSLQAVLVAVATRPGVFYRVPAARLALDGVIYLCMLVVYTVVLYRAKAGNVDPCEVLLYVWVIGTCVSRGAGGGFGDDATELDDEDPTAKRVEQQRQRQEDSPQGEGQDRGRSCCCPPFVEGRLATVVLVAAMLCRIGDYSQASFLFFLDLDEFLHVDGEFGFFEVSLVLLAAAAPFLLLGLLRAAAAFLPELGPTVKAISLLAREAFKVLPTMACLLFGTALALHVLFGEGSSLLEGEDYPEAFVEAFRTFGVSCGTVTRAGLGDVYVPDDDLPYGEALQAFLYLFAAAGALGLVSILVAVLANTKAAGPDEMEKRFQLTRARVIIRAAEASRGDTLPPPFNLAQGALTLLVSATQCCRRTPERRKRVSRACSRLGRFVFWLVMGSLALISAVLLYFASLPWFWWISLKRVVETPGETPGTLLAVARTTVWCFFGVPVRLFVSWILAATQVVGGDKAGRRARMAVRRSVLRGREGGDYDLSRMLRRTRWGAGGGSNSLAQGCSVRDIVAAMEDPLQRGCCFRNVSSCFADEGPGTVAQMKALARRNQEHQTRISDRLKGLEVAVLSTLARMDAVSDETARVQQQYLTSQSQQVPT